MSSELDAGEIGASMLAASSLPAYLRVEAQYGTIVCTEHRLGYTPNNIARHLIDAHKTPKVVRDQAMQYIEASNVAPIVSEPRHSSAPITGLQVLRGWQCNVHGCESISQSKTTIEKHCSKEHGFDSKRKRDEHDVVVQVSVQRWFAKTNKYWIVNPRATTQPPTSQPSTTPRPSVYNSSPPLRPTFPASLHNSPSASAPPSLPTPSISRSNFFLRMYSQVQEEHEQNRRAVQEAEHTSEVSPWERVSGYRRHFGDLDMITVASLLAVPRKVEQHAHMFHLGKSIARVLKAAYRLVPDLHPNVATILLSFEEDRFAADHFTYLQNSASFKKYISTCQSMVCYFYRSVLEEPFTPVLFEVTNRQEAALRQVEATIELWIASLARHQEDDDDDDEQSPSERDLPAEEQRLQSAVDAATLELLVALIQHRTFRNPYQSAIMSFCAAFSHRRHSNQLLDESMAGSVLSQVIYCCQLVFLATAALESAGDQDEVFIASVTAQVDQWMRNRQYGPMAEMVRLRRYCMSVASRVVNAAPIRWRADNETLMYKDITFRVSDLVTEIRFCLEQAESIFHRDLCFDLPDVPRFNLADFEDNWDDLAPGASFLTDARNTGIVEGHRDWLFAEIVNRSELYDLIMQHQNDQDPSEDQVRSVFAQEYEAAVEQFFKYMSILLHKGSGQPGRAPEFLGLRWQNKRDGQATRNLFMHDGYLLFLLTYHKSLHRTHASRYPVRFLLPEVSEYLWSDGKSIWSQERFARYGRMISQQAHGVPVNMSAWRQIAVAIAMKKFSGTNYQADLDMKSDETDDLAGQSILDSWGGAMADVFHHQAAHSVSTGNRIYGGTVNFDRGLTDAGLQEYFKASRLWHQLCRPRALSSLSGHRRQASTESIHPALRQRLEYRARPSQHRLRWGSEQVHSAMRQLFGTADAQFRSVQQEQLIDAVVTKCPEVIGILATGEGKSLAFLLPAFMPRAATTVVVVPLVALKADIVRRCQDAGFSYAVWDRYKETRHYVGVPLLFVSVDQAVKRGFRAFLGQLDASERLERVVFDEAHLILTAAAYRPNMGLVRQLRQLYCQIVCLTATLPPVMQAQFEARMLMKEPRVIRSRTFRADLAYRLRHSSDANLMTYTVRVVRQLLDHYTDQPTARLLVYTPTRLLADQLSEKLSCPKYYSDSGDADEKLQAMQAWRLGQSRVLIATSAFGLGIDFPSVREVIHIGCPTDMIEFAQEVGRLSRDGQGGHSRVIMPRGWVNPGLPSVADQRRSAVSQMAMFVYLGENRCLSAVLSRFLDGPDQMQYCTQANPRLRCSKCAQFGLFQAATDTDHTVWWDAHSGHGHDTASSEDDIDAGDAVSSLEGSAFTSAVVVDAGASGQRLRQSMREDAMGRQRYEDGIRLLRGRCMLCMMLGQGHISREEQYHELHHCRSIYRREFIRDKQSAINRNRDRGGWMKGYVACFRCGQPQDICHVDTQVSSRPCEFRDMVFPATWALFHQESRWGQSLTGFSGATASVCGDLSTWMDWLGGDSEMYGMRVSQAARMMDQIVQHELMDVLDQGAGDHGV